MRTLGIDLSSQPQNTAAFLLNWEKGVPSCVEYQMGCFDDDLDELIKEAEAIGIDAPFGWPDAFREQVGNWSFERWDDERRDQLTLRKTDRWIKNEKGIELQPLRVSADRIAIPAMRTMAMLHRNGVVDRSGPKSGKFFEVYPAATLERWSLDRKGYKADDDDGHAARLGILQGVRDRFGMSVGDEVAKTDHLLDALVAALTAYAAKNGETSEPDDESMEAARREGWIHVPR